MVSNTTTIQVDPEAAEILRRAAAHARSHGETLGDYLRHALPQDSLKENGTSRPSQIDAWTAFVTGMTRLVESSTPQGHLADDSRESMYDDRG